MKNSSIGNRTNTFHVKEEMKMKKGIKKYIGIFLTVLMIVVNTMPAFATAATAKNAAAGYVIPASMTIQVGEQKKLSVTQPAGKYANVAFQYVPHYVTTSGYSAGAYWGKKAEITFTGKAPGTFDAIVTLDVHSKAGVPSSSYAKYYLYCKVTVVKKGTSTTTNTSPKKTALQKIALNKNTVTINTGNTDRLTVSYIPSNTTDSRSVIWSSNNIGVATVNGGRVTAKKPGTATITAKVGSKTATCKVIVKAPLKSISLNKASASMAAGNTLNLSVTYNPSNTTDSKTVTWSSSNRSVATVSAGKVTAKKAGSTTITAKVGSKTATCKVTVKASSSNGSSSSGSSASKDSYKNVTDAYTILNTFRTTKANQWYWRANNTSKVTTYGLKKLTRDTLLEKVAKTRAKEAWIMYYQKGRATHDRPNGTDCFTAYPASLQYVGENLAWGHTTSRSVIADPNSGWAETNHKYSGQGHRRNMLDRNFTRVGIACYVKDGKTCWAMCLGK